ncbi:MAG TPA: citramalate synthase [Verrucomicrobiae bacterium]|nr:citramalate synthase [Verrucomicrobiae bacterium]
MNVLLYDTTLRDGCQGEGVQFSVEDKLRIVNKLDQLGIAYIEGGWPGANPRDIEFFARAKSLQLTHSRLTAFGSTCRPGGSAENDPVLYQLLEAGTPVVTIFGKTWSLHVTHVLQTSLEENLRMIRESIAHLKSKGREVIYDAEHFFDGYKSNPDYALDTLKAALEGGADWLVLCDTNGGTMPLELAEIVNSVKASIPTPLGIHAHNDCGLAVANSLLAVQSGVAHVQGTFNGYGERCGNADLVTIIPNLQLKLGMKIIPDLSQLNSTARFISELANVIHNEHQPYVGKSAFAHKAGMHVDGVIKISKSFEHINPALVGNNRRILVSDQAGRGNILAKIKRYCPNIDKNSPVVTNLLTKLKQLEFQGYQFEAAEGSLELLIKKQLGLYQPSFELEDFRFLIAKDGQNNMASEAIVKIRVNNQTVHVVSNGAGPVNAVDKALRKALEPFFPILSEMELADYKVRVIDGTTGTGALVKVLIETRYHGDIWGTVGVSENIIEASILALAESLEYGLMRFAGGCSGAAEAGGS